MSLTLVLMIEDNPGDVVLLQEAVRQAGLEYQVDCVSDAVQARERFRAIAAGAATCPDLIVLDLNLPGLNGWQVHEMMADCPPLARTPTVVLTSLACQEEGVPGVRHFMKPPSFDGMLAVVRQMEEYRRSYSSSTR